ncbi:MAG: RHS repeat-associated core domain-containing protein [Candidatus Sumerlaeia bacterium]|nr:RHS repeat-associated core domain-containing protein [Candidatus Sumerlaeia bacterium]
MPTIHSREANGSAQLRVWDEAKVSVRAANGTLSSNAREGVAAGALLAPAVRTTQSARAPLSAAQSSIGLKFLFTARPWTPVGEVYHLRARWYSPLEGRFISRDPHGYQDLTLFCYASGDPVNAVDPLGTATVFLEAGFKSSNNKCESYHTGLGFDWDGQYTGMPQGSHIAGPGRDGDPTRINYGAANNPNRQDASSVTQFFSFWVPDDVLLEVVRERVPKDDEYEYNLFANNCNKYTFEFVETLLRKTVYRLEIGSFQRDLYEDMLQDLQKRKRKWDIPTGDTAKFWEDFAKQCPRTECAIVDIPIDERSSYGPCIYPSDPILDWAERWRNWTPGGIQWD